MSDVVDDLLSLASTGDGTTQDVARLAAEEIERLRSTIVLSRMERLAMSLAIDSMKAVRRRKGCTPDQADWWDNAASSLVCLLSRLG